MQSDFAAKCKQAILAAQVPPVPMAAIRSASNTPSVAKAPRRATLLYSSLFVVASGLTAAFGAQIVDRAYVYLGAPRGPHISAYSLSMSWKPTPAQLRSVLANASYRVIVPSGLPKEARLVALGSIGHDVILFDYSYPRRAGDGRGTASILVGPPEMLSVSRKVLQQGVALNTKGGHAAIHWEVGREETLLLGNTLSLPEISRIRQAMQQRPCVLWSQIGHETPNPNRALHGCSYEFGALTRRK